MAFDEIGETIGELGTAAAESVGSVAETAGDIAQQSAEIVPETALVIPEETFSSIETLAPTDPHNALEVMSEMELVVSEEAALVPVEVGELELDTDIVDATWREIHDELPYPDVMALPELVDEVDDFYVDRVDSLADRGRELFGNRAVYTFFREFAKMGEGPMKKAETVSRVLTRHDGANFSDVLLGVLYALPVEVSETYIKQVEEEIEEEEKRKAQVKVKENVAGAQDGSTPTSSPGVENVPTGASEALPTGGLDALPVPDPSNYGEVLGNVGGKVADAVGNVASSVKSG